MTDPLCFDAITVHRMYGARFRGLRVDGLCGGINVICGPNAAGKTTLVRALRTVLWPEGDRNGACELVGRFSMNGSAWRIDLDGAGPRYQRDGQAAEAPRLPAPDHHTRYYLHLHDLLRITEDDDFANAILRDAVGGYDVQKAAGARGFKEVRPHSGKATRQLDEARTELDAVRREQEKVRREQEQLDDLEAELEKARHAELRCDLFDVALTFARRREKLREARAALEQLPEILDEVRGDEIERLDALRQQRDDARHDAAGAEDRLEDAARILDASRIPADGLPEGLITELADRTEQLRRGEEEVAQHRKDLAARRAEREDAARVLGDVDQDALATLDLGDVRDIGRRLRRAEGVRAERAALQQLLRLLDEDEASDTDYEEAARLLRRWLRSARSVEAGVPPVVRYGTLAAAGLLVVAAAVGAALGVPSALLLLSVAALLGFVYAKLPADGGQAAEAGVHQREYRRLDVEPPARWDEEAVEKRLEELFEAQAEVVLQRRAATKHREASEREREAVSELAEVEEARRDAAHRLGLDPEILDEGLVLFVEALARWQQAHADVLALEEKLQAAEADADAARTAVTDVLAPYDFEPVGDASGARAAVDVLRDAQQEWEGARRDRQEARRDVERANTKSGEAEGDIEALFAGLELDAGDDAGLRHLVERRPDYEEARRAAGEAETAFRIERERLQEHELYERRLDDAGLEALERERERAAQAAGHVGRLTREIEQIRERVRRLRTQHDLERARAECEARLEELRREREHDFRRTAGWRLAEYVRRQTHDHDLPDVFHRARDHFNIITGGKYELRFDKENCRFTAYEAATERGLELDMLSSGTRVQLLLAVRIAFIEKQERHVGLPLVLDETLANSDDTRARAIIEGVLWLSRAGRQIFYFTAQDDEVAKWKAVARAYDDLDARFIQLRGDEGPVEIDTEALPVAFDGDGVQHPAEHDHAAYGALLGVPAWDGYARLGQLHLWYLVEDPALLHRLLCRGVSRWGPLHNLLATGTLSALDVTAEELAPARVAGRAIGAWQHAWQEGRGRRVGRAALEATDAVSDTFLDRVCELARRLGGDGRAIVDALHDGEVKRFHGSKTEELEEYFVAEGYIDMNEPLSSEAIWAQVLAAVDGDMEAAGVDAAMLRRVLDRVRTGPPRRKPAPATNGEVPVPGAGGKRS